MNRVIAKLGVGSDAVKTARIDLDFGRVTFRIDELLDALDNM